MREPDIKLVKLKRLTLDKKMKEFGQQSDDSESLGIKSWLVADYFDKMQVEILHMVTPFSEWLDIAMDNNDKEQREDVIAAQSYTLYCSSTMQEEYEERKGKPYRRDPFAPDQDYNPGMDIISIIHVYIMPEILARINIKADEIDDGNGILLRPFIDDLYDILDLFFKNNSEKNSGEPFAARVYMMLSAGDFAIVIRSKEPDVAHHIATYIRRRKAKKEPEEGQKNTSAETAYVLYKTYTLSTIRKKISQDQGTKCTQEQKKEKDRFIVRGCYSDQYWKNGIQAKSVDSDEGRVHALSGRYDFTVRLSEEEYGQIMFSGNNEEIGDTERIGNIEGTENTEEHGVTQRTRAKQLADLIKNKGLSSINERYLMEDINEPLGLGEADTVSKSVFLSKDADRDSKSLKEENKSHINALYSMWDQIMEASRAILGYRKNIGQYLYMLRKEIYLCASVNESSDTRIYAKMLLELLDAILAAVKRYIDKRGNNSNICSEEMDALEDNLREAIIVLDSYAQYIRNNNLQSIQTPNYDIETSMGAEKILIGYSELLWCFIEFYKRVIPDASQTEYLTVMVPTRYDKDVNINELFPDEETLRPEVTLSDGETEESQAGSQDKRLIVIGSPTLEELTDFPVIFPALFHEVAHQFRYENRLARNRAILRPVVREIMHGFSKYMTTVVDERLEDEANEAGGLCETLTEALTTLFIERKYPSEKNGEIKDKSLAQFQDDLYRDINELFDIWRQKARLKVRIREFIFDLRYELDCSDPATVELIRKMNTVVENDRQSKTDADQSKAGSEQMKTNGKAKYDTCKMIRETETYAFNLAGRCASRYWKNTGKEWETVDVGDEEDRCWDLEWRQIFRESDVNGSKEFRQIQEVLMHFLDWTGGYRNELKEDHIDEIDFKSWGKGERNSQEDSKESLEESLEESLYSLMVKYWEDVAKKSAAAYCGEENKEGEDKNQQGTASCDGSEKGKKEDDSAPSYRYWAHMGRKLGLDYDNQFEKFDAVVKDALRPCGYHVELSFAGIYREETADLLMCNVMQMKPLQYLNLVVSLFVSENNFFHGTDLERIFCVLYIQWCYDENAETSWKKYRKLLHSIFSDIIAIEKRLLSKLPNIQLGQGFPEEEILCGDSGIDNSITENIIAANMEYMEECRTWIIAHKDVQDRNRVLGELNNILRLCGLLSDLVWNSKYYWKKLHEDEELAADLMAGREELSRLEERKDSSGRKDYYKKGIDKIYKAGKCVSKYLSESYSQKGIGSSTGSCKELNRECMELLLMMFYHNKIRTAQERISEQTDGD